MRNLVTKRAAESRLKNIERHKKLLLISLVATIIFVAVMVVPNLQLLKYDFEGSTLFDAKELLEQGDIPIEYNIKTKVENGNRIVIISEMFEEMPITAAGIEQELYWVKTSDGREITYKKYTNRNAYLLNIIFSLFLAGFIVAISIFYGIPTIIDIILIKMKIIS